MKIFKLFTRKPVVHNVKTESVIEEEKTYSSIEKDLFVAQEDNSINQNLFEPMNRKQNCKDDSLSVFLRQDFTLMGRKNGYEAQSGDRLSNYINFIKGKFKEAVAKDIEEIEKEILNDKIRITLLSNLDSSLKKSIELKISYLEDKVADLLWEQNNSINNEGKISQCIIAYSLGFTQGVEDYCIELNFLNL